MRSLKRTESGFVPISYEEALDYTANRLKAIRDKYGPDAIAIYGGASMITEKAYAPGQIRARRRRDEAHRL